MSRPGGQPQPVPSRKAIVGFCGSNAAFATSDSQPMRTPTVCSNSGMYGLISRSGVSSRMSSAAT